MKEVVNTNETSMKQDIDTILIWQSQMDAKSAFYQKYFGIKIDWTKIKLPTWTKECPRLELILSEVTGQMLINCYKKEFGNDQVSDNVFTQDLDKNIKTQQSRSTEPYAFAWSGEVECDVEWRKKSYNDIKETKQKLMIPKEYIIAALRFRIETGTMLDQKNVTFLHALNFDLRMIYMGKGGFGRFFVDGLGVDDLDCDYGFRQVNLDL